MANSIMVIQPYWTSGTWVFDDPAAGLTREPFVAGIPEMIDKMLELAGIKRDDAVPGFRMLFSATPFPAAHVQLDHAENDAGGNWYEWRQQELKGWLCPALFKYFDVAPCQIYIRAEPLK